MVFEAEATSDDGRSGADVDEPHNVRLSARTNVFVNALTFEVGALHKYEWSELLV